MFYPKIQSPFKRTEKREFLSEYSLKVFAALSNIEYEVYEKMDGYNIRLYWDGEKVNVAGKSDDTQMPVRHLQYLQTQFTSDKFTDMDQCYLFGELVGESCHTNLYNLKLTEFILFDTYRIQTNAWQSQEYVKKIGDRFSVRTPELLGIATLKTVVGKFYHKTAIHDSVMFPGCNAEGVILRPVVDLFLSNGDRVITKLKFKDKFHETFYFT